MADGYTHVGEMQTAEAWRQSSTTHCRPAIHLNHFSLHRFLAALHRRQQQHWELKKLTGRGAKS